MSDILVSYGSLVSLSAAMTQASSASAADLDAMDAELRPTQSDWSGSAQQQYTVSMAECRSALANMNALIGQLGTHVSTSSENYSSTDQQAAGYF